MKRRDIHMHAVYVQGAEQDLGRFHAPGAAPEGDGLLPFSCRYRRCPA